MQEFRAAIRSLFPIIAAALASASPAHAYVGPGAGLGAIALTIAFVLGLALLIAGFLWYPLKRLVNARKRKRESAETDKRA